MPGQTVIGGDYRSPGSPAGQTCEWCGDPAETSVERRAGWKWLGTGQFVYACWDHAEKAETMCARPERGA